MTGTQQACLVRGCAALPTQHSSVLYAEEEPRVFCNEEEQQLLDYIWIEEFDEEGIWDNGLKNN